MSLSQLFCGVFTFLMILLWKEVFRKQSINYLFFVSFFKTKTWKTFENTSNVLIWRYTLIKANALHKIAVYLNVFFFFRKTFFSAKGRVTTKKWLQKSREVFAKKEMIATVSGQNHWKMAVTDFMFQFNFQTAST